MPDRTTDSASNLACPASSPKRRIETDVMKLLMSDYDVQLVNDNMQVCRTLLLVGREG